MSTRISKKLKQEDEGGDEDADEDDLVPPGHQGGAWGSLTTLHPHSLTRAVVYQGYNYPL